MTRTGLVVVVTVLLVTWPVGTAGGVSVGSATDSADLSPVQQSQADPSAVSDLNYDEPTYVVDKDGGGDFTAIQPAVDEASAGDVIEVRPGTYPEDIILTKDVVLVAPDGATLDGSSLEEDDRGVVIAQTAAPTVHGFTITSYGTGVLLAESTGDWTVSNVTITNNRWDGVRARYAAGNWTIRNSVIADNAGRGVVVDNSIGDWLIEGTTIKNNDDEPALDSARGIGVDASGADGNWTIRDSVITGHVDGTGLGVDASASSGAWTIENTDIGSNVGGIWAFGSSGDWTIARSTVSEAAEGAVIALESRGDWVIDDTVIEDSGTGVEAFRAEGDWRIRESTVTNNEDGVLAIETNGSWAIHETSIVGNDRGGVVAINATIAGDASRNWWGACDGPSGDFDGSGDPAGGNLIVEPFYTDAEQQTLSDETASPCGESSFDFGVELQQSETVSQGGTANVSAFVNNLASDPVPGVTAELLVDADSDGQFESGEVVASETVDFAADGYREVALVYPDVQLTAGEYRYMARVSKDGQTVRSYTNGTLTVERTLATISYAPTRPEPGQTVDFAATVEDPDTSVQSYEWRVDGEVVASGPETSWTFETGGDHRVSLTVTDEEGASDTTNTTVTVEALNRPPVARIGANRTIVTGDRNAVAFEASDATDPDGEIADYRWDLDGDGATDATGPQAVASFPRDPDQSRTVVVALTVTDDEGATDTSRLRISVPADRNQAPTAAFSTAPANPKPGQDVTLNASAAIDPDGTIQSYEWEFDEDGTVDATGPTITRNVTTMRENVTLTVTDDEGATDTVTRTVTAQSLVVVPNGTITIDTSINEPPVVQFTAAPQLPEPDENATFTSQSYDPDGNITEYQWYRNGSEISDGSGFIKDFRPEDVTTFFGDAGPRNITLAVTDDEGRTNTTTKIVEVKERDDAPTAALSVRSAEPSDPSPNTFEVGESLLLDGSATSAVQGRSIRTYQWEVVKQSGAGFEPRYGRSATLSLGSPGTWAVSLIVTDSSGETDRTTKTIEVAERGEIPRIESISQDPEGLPLAGVDLDMTYSVNVTAADPISKVEFERGGQTYVDSDGSDGWTHSLNPRNLPGNQRMTVTVTDDEGDTDSETVPIEINEPPAWISAFLFEDSGTSAGPWPEIKRNVKVGTNDQGDTVVKFNFTLTPVDFQQSVKVGIELGAVGFSLDADGRLVYNMESAMAHAEGGYDGGASVAKDLVEGGVNAQVNASGVVDARNWTVKRGVMRGNASVMVSKSFSPPIKFGPEFGASITAGVGITQKWAQRNGALETVDGQVRPRLAGRAHAALWLTKWVYFGGSAKLMLVGYIPFANSQSGYGLKTTLAVEGRYKFFSYNDSVRTTFVSELGDTGTLALRPVDVERSGWELEPKYRGQPPGGNATVTLGADGATQAIVGGDRLTRDTVVDESPAVAYDGNYTAVWVRQDPEKAVSDGYDVYASTSPEGGAWSQPTKVTDDLTTEVRPDVAAAGDRLLAAWTRVNASLDEIDGPGAALDRTEVAYALRDGDGWGSPVTLTDDSAVDLEPVVAGSDERFLVAWVSDPEDANTTADQRVRYAVSGADSGLGPVQTVPNATDVAVADSDDGGFTLAYLRSDDGENGTVVQTTVAADGSRTERTRYPVTGFTGLTAAGDTLAWGTRDGLRFAGDGALETVPTPNDTSPTEIDLVVDGGSPFVTYRAVTPSSATPQVHYQRRTTDGWLAPRPLTRGVPTGLSALQAGTASGPDGLVSVTAARNVSRNGNNDLFAVRQRFAPDLTVSASTDADLRTTTAGDQVRVDYTVRNVGDRAATDRVAVTLENGSGTVATETLAPLDAGQRTSGSFTASVDASGTVDVVVDPAGDVAELDESNNRVTQAVARPDLVAGTVTEQREGGDLVLSATVRNRGPVAVADTTVRLRSGGVPVANRTVDLQARSTRTVRLRVPADDIDGSLPSAVVIDPADRIAERSEANNERYVRLAGVDLGVSTSGTTAAADGVLAELFVSNAETGNSTALVRLDGATQSLTYRLPVPGAPGPDTPSFERVRLYHPAPDGTLDVSVTPVGTRDAATLDNGARTAVTTDGPETTPLSVTGISGTIENNTGTLRVTVGNDGAVAVGAPVTVILNGTTVANGTVVVGPNATESATLPADIAPGPYEATVTAPGTSFTETVRITDVPDLTGDGRPARDPDGDGLYEDIDGDGLTNIFDAITLYNNRNSDGVRQNADRFNFDGTGGVDLFDAIALYNEIS